jgi:hypothetical protein
MYARHSKAETNAFVKPSRGPIDNLIRSGIVTLYCLKLQNTATVAAHFSASKIYCAVRIIYANACVSISKKNCVHATWFLSKTETETGDSETFKSEAETRRGIGIP